VRGFGAGILRVWVAGWAAAAGLGGQALTPVEGRVVDTLTGNGVARAVVTLRWDGPGAGPGALAAVRSDDEGRWRTEVPVRGPYVVSAVKPGYLTPPGMPECAWAEEGTKAVVVTVPLTPHSVLSGKVLDEDEEPLQGVRVLAGRWQRRGGGLRFEPAGEGSVVTNERGEYRIVGLRAGEYVVRVSYEKGDGYDEMFYPGVWSAEESRAVRVKTGAEAAGLDVRLRRVARYKVRGHAMAGARLTRLSLDLDMMGTALRLERGATAQEDGTFSLSGVSPGHYLLLAERKNEVVGSARVRVTDHDVEGVEVAAVAPGVVRGRVRFGGAPGGFPTDGVDRTKCRVWLVPRNPAFATESSTAVRADGTFQLTYPFPGTYELDAACGDYWYLNAVRIGEENLFGRPLELPGGVMEMGLEFRGDWAYLDVELKGVWSYTVVAAPELDGPTCHPWDWNVEPRVNFSLGGFRPGRYRVFATEQGYLYRSDPERFLREVWERAAVVELKREERTVVKAPLLRLEE